MSFNQKNKQKLIPLTLWLVIAGGFWMYARQTDLSLTKVVDRFSYFLRENPFGPLLFLAIFLIRPLLFYPNSVLMVLAGFLYGPLLGLLLGLIGETMTAMAAFGIGLHFGAGLFQTQRSQTKLGQYTEALKHNGFQTVLIMRLLMFNVDLISYPAGILHVNWLSFLGATILGSLIGTPAYILAGASIEGDFTGQLPDLDPLLSSVAAILFVGSLVIAWFVRRRQRQAESVTGRRIGPYEKNI